MKIVFVYADFFQILLISKEIVPFPLLDVLSSCFSSHAQFIFFATINVWDSRGIVVEHESLGHKLRGLNLTGVSSP